MIAEVVEAAFGDDAALMKHIDSIEMRQQVQAVHRRDDRLIGKSLEESFIDHRLGTRVYAAGGFVQQDPFTVAGGQDAPGEGESLFLSTGEVDSFLADIRLQPLRELPDDFRE